MNNATIQIKITQELKDKAQAEAKEKGLTLSGYIKLLISNDTNKA